MVRSVIGTWSTDEDTKMMMLEAWNWLLGSPGVGTDELNSGWVVPAHWKPSVGGKVQAWHHLTVGCIKIFTGLNAGRSSGDRSIVACFNPPHGFDVPVHHELSSGFDVQSFIAPGSIPWSHALYEQDFVTVRIRHEASSHPAKHSPYTITTPEHGKIVSRA